MLIRYATQADVPAIVDIYNVLIPTTQRDVTAL